jgi:hypothetical protein
MIEFKGVDEHPADVGTFPGINAARLAEKTSAERFGGVHRKTEMSD